MFEKLNHMSLFDQRLAASFVSFSLTLKIIVVSVDLSSRRCYHLSISTPRSSRLGDYRDSTGLGTSRSFGEGALRLPALSAASPIPGTACPARLCSILGPCSYAAGSIFRGFLDQASDSSSSHETLQGSAQAGRLSGTEARSRPSRSLPLRLVTLVSYFLGESFFCFLCFSSETSSRSGIQRFLPEPERFHSYAPQQPDLCLV